MIEHARAFAAEVHYWVRKLGVLGWEIAVAIERLPADTRAKCVYTEGNRWARIVLNERHLPNLTAEQVARSAFHEVLHLVLQPLADLAKERSEEPEHAVIRTLENTLWAEDWARRSAPSAQPPALEPVPALAGAM